MLIVADSKIPFLNGVLEPFADVRYLPPDRISVDAVRDADALVIRTRTRCAAPLLDGSRVSMIATATIGTDHIDPAYCAAHGIEWTGAPGCNAASVAQHMTSALLRIALRHGMDLRGKTLGIVGCGNVGAKVAAAAAALGMNMLVNDPPRAEREGNVGFVPLERIQREADFITLHVPLTHSGPYRTFHLADEDFFRNLRRRPFFFNTSRGDVTDGNALKSAIITGRISGAALDVWPDEPDIDGELLSLVELATPHIAGYSTDGKANGTSMAVRAVARHFGIAPLLNFYPAEIPAPSNPDIKLDPCSPHPLADAVFASYDIATDDAALRAAPEDFEALRGSYRVRREYPAYTVRSDRPLPSALRDALLKLGFRLA
jgi:erythronate-4-phosphate dehydrogenase